jgi:hypothetical protein
VSLRTEYQVFNLGDRVLLLKVLLEPHVQCETTFANLAEARKIAREAADFLGVEVEDETRLRLVQ